MTQTQQVDPVQTKELGLRATALVGWAWSADTRLSDDAPRTFRSRGFGRYLPTTTKGNVDPLLTTDEGVDLHRLQTAFLGLTNDQSLVGPLLAGGAVPIPLTATARLQVGEVIASEVAELGVKPVAMITFDVAGLGTKVEAQIVVSAEAARALDLPTQDGIRQVLVAACARATDRALLDVLTAGAPAGSATPAVLLAAISGGQPSAPFLIGGYDALLGLAPGTLRDLRDLGIQILASPAAAGQLVALDASGLLVSDGGVEVRTARHASMLMDDGGSPAGTTVLNMWQSNLECVRAERYLRFALRAGAAAWAAVTP